MISKPLLKKNHPPSQSNSPKLRRINNQIILSTPDTEKETTHQPMRSQFQIISFNHWLLQMAKMSTISKCHTRILDPQKFMFQVWTLSLKKVILWLNKKLRRINNQIILSTPDTEKETTHQPMRSQFQSISSSHWSSPTSRTSMISRCPTRITDHQESIHQAWKLLPRKVLTDKNLQLV